MAAAERLLQPISSGSRRLALLFKLASAGKPFWRHPALQWRPKSSASCAATALARRKRSCAAIAGVIRLFCEEVTAADPSGGSPAGSQTRAA